MRRHFPSVWGLLSVDSAAGLLRGGISSDQCHCGRPQDRCGTTYIKPNTKVKIQRQKVPDDEDIDIIKIVKDNKPRYDRKTATELERQLREKNAKRLGLEKAKRI